MRRVMIVVSSDTRSALPISELAGRSLRLDNGKTRRGKVMNVMSLIGIIRQSHTCEYIKVCHDSLPPDLFRNCSSSYSTYKTKTNQSNPKNQSIHLIHHSYPSQQRHPLKQHLQNQSITRASTQTHKTNRKPSPIFHNGCRSELRPERLSHDRQRVDGHRERHRKHPACYH